MLDGEFNHSIIFPSDIVTCEWQKTEKLNAEIKQTVLDIESKQEGTISGNTVGGYHSDWNFIHDDYACNKELKAMINEMLEGMAEAGGRRIDNKAINLTGWFNITRRGNYRTAHKHPNNVWSGVY